jgi:hypothetical protein
MPDRCSICGGYHVRFWRRMRAFHWFLAMSLTVRIVRKPWWPKNDEPFDNISWRTAWDVSKGIHLQRGF